MQPAGGLILPAGPVRVGEMVGWSQQRRIQLASDSIVGRGVLTTAEARFLFM
jgi:hypothetical protein